MLCRISNFIFNRIYSLKSFIYRINLLGIKVGKNFHIYGKVKIMGNRCNIQIGDNCSLNEGVLLNVGGNAKIKIGNNVTISPYVIITTGKLDISNWPTDKHIWQDIIIEDNVWIASHCIIGGGVKIGKNVIVGANSFVNKNLEEGYFYAGNPAKKICKISEIKIK